MTKACSDQPATSFVPSGAMGSESLFDFSGSFSTVELGQVDIRTFHCEHCQHSRGERVATRAAWAFRCPLHTVLYCISSIA